MKVAKRRKGNRKHLRKKRRNKNKSRNKKSRDRNGNNKQNNKRNKHTSREPDQILSNEFKARQRKQDLIFIAGIIIFVVIIIGGYFLFDNFINTADERSDEHNSDDIANSNGNEETIEINWHEYNEGLQLASNNNKPVMIDFYTDLCGFCKDMDRDTYGDSRVIEKSKDFVCIKVDGDVRQDLINSYAITGYPTTIFLNSQEAEINRVTGYKPPGPFLDEMDKALNGI